MLSEQAEFPMLTCDSIASTHLEAHRLVNQAGSYTLAGGLAFGVTRHAMDQDQLGPVDVHAFVKVEAGAAFTKDVPLMAGDDGKVIAHDGDASHFPVGRSLQSSTGDGHLVSVWLIPHTGMLAVPVGG